LIASELPDLPRWVEAHGIAADRDGWREPLGAGFALGHRAMKLAVVCGDADAAATRAFASAQPDLTVLCAIEREDLVAALRAVDRPLARAILHTLADPAQLPGGDGAVPLPDDAALDRVPRALAGELAWARTRGPIWCAYVDGEPASFAFAPWRSAGWFDVSVDTSPSARRLGLGTIVAAAMIRDERSRGREPVWGADEANVASLALARRLGFAPVDEIWVAPCADS
jgi:hypothetical protein